MENSPSYFTEVTYGNTAPAQLTKQTLAQHADETASHPIPLQPNRPRPHTPLDSTLGSGSGGDSSKLPQHPPVNVTSPLSSSASKTQSPDPLETPPKLVESPIPLPAPVKPRLQSMQTPVLLHSNVSDAEPSVPRHPSRSSPSSESDAHVGPTRASIRAWAQATQSGPPQNTPSPRTRAVAASSSDDNLILVSRTRSVDLATSLQQSDNVSSGDESPAAAVGTSVADGNESCGNAADAENSSSGGLSSASPPIARDSPSPPNEPRREHRQLLPPHPHQHGHPHTHVHLHPVRPHPHPHQPQASSAHAHAHQHAHPDSHSHFHNAPSHPHKPKLSHPSPPPLQPQPRPQASTPEQQLQDRLERRQHRHARRRYRDRERERERERERDRRTRGSGAAPSPTPAFTPLRAPPPPASAPMGSPRARTHLRPLRIVGEPGADVLEEIAKMVAGAREPLLRAGSEDDRGWVRLGGGGGGGGGGRDDGDVIHDIFRMLQWTHGR